MIFRAYRLGRQAALQSAIMDYYALTVNSILWSLVTALYPSVRD